MPLFPRHASYFPTRTICLPHICLHTVYLVRIQETSISENDVGSGDFIIHVLVTSDVLFCFTVDDILKKGCKYLINQFFLRKRSELMVQCIINTFIIDIALCVNPCVDMGNDVVTNSLTKLLIAKYDVLYDGDCPQFAPESSIKYQLYVVLDFFIRPIREGSKCHSFENRTLP